MARKAWALTERNKNKDGYDVVWLLKAYGPENVARRFREVGLPESDFGRQAIAHLAECFRTHEHTGPVGWVTESQFSGQERVRELRDAAGTVQEFVRQVRG